MADLLFVGQFIASKAGKTGLTVTVDVDRYTLADGSRTALVTAGSATEGRRGLYHYRLASADLATYQYVATFITADATVDQQEIAALGIVVPDALVGSRLAPATAGRTLDVDASGNASANVTLWKGATAPDAPPTAAAVATVDANVDAIKVITDQLDVTAVTQVTASSAGHLTITAGLTFDEPVTGLVIPADWEAAYWTLKRNPVQPDTAALVRLLVTNPAGESDGLQRLKGAEPASPITEADGTLTVTQATGRIDIWLSDELTANLNAATSLGWDVKFIDSAGDSTGRRGTADVVLTETHATA